MLENLGNNVSNLSVNVDILLASYLIKELKCRGGPLSDPLKLYHKITKYYLSKNYFSWVRFVSSNYLLKENVINTFQSYVRIMSEIYVRLTLGNCLIKSGKWDQEITY